MKQLRYLVSLVFVVVLFLGCAQYMKPASPEAVSLYKPNKNESLIIFSRPFPYGGKSSVFDVTTKGNILVGIVPAKTKVAYKITAGEHLFMVIGESADFMKANLEGGKTYYALLNLRMGAWQARFSLVPINKSTLKLEAFMDSVRSCKFVENTDASYNWANDHAENIQSMREDYYRKWMSKPEQDRPVLSSEDGI